MPDDVKELSLSGIARGAAEELFREAMQQVIENIDDPNTDWKAKRRVTLVFDVTADETRKVGHVGIAISTKLAGVKGLKIGVYFGRHHGVLMATEAPSQEDLFTSPKGGPRSLTLEAGGETGA